MLHTAITLASLAGGDAKDCVMSLSHTLRLSRRTLLRQLGAAGVLITLGPAGARATQEMVQQAICEGLV